MFTPRGSLFLTFVIIFATLPSTRGYRNITSLLVSSWPPALDGFIDSISQSVDHLGDLLVESDDPLIIDGEKIKLRMKIVNDFLNKTYAEELYREALNDPSISFFLSPSVTTRAPPIIPLMNANNRLMLSISNLFNEQSAGHTCCLSVGLSPSTIFFATLPSLRVVGAKTITIITTEAEDEAENGVTQRCKSSLFRDELRLQGFSVKSEYTITSGNIFEFTTKPYTNFTDDLLANISQTAVLAKEDDADAWLFCVTIPDSVGAMMNTLRQLDYTPRYIGISMSPHNRNTVFDQDLWQYVTASIDFWDDMTFPPTKYFGNTTNIQQGYRERYGAEFAGEAIPFSPWLSALNAAIKTAINDGNTLKVNNASRLELVSSNTNNCGGDILADILYQNIIRQKIDSIGGIYSWNGNAAQQRDWLHLQLQEKGKFILIGPPTTKQADLIYPMPKWHERVFDPQYGHWTEIFVTIIVVLLLCVNIGWAIFLPLNLNNRDVKASSPLFMGVMLLGSSLLYLSVFTLMPNINSKVTCVLCIWVLDLGFILLFGPLLGKTLRLDRLYHMKTTEIIRISDKMVFLWVASLVVCHLILLAVLTGLGHFESEIVVVDPIRVFQNYNACNYDTAFLIMMYIIGASNAILLLVCSIYAFRIRTIPIKRFNESQIIFFAVYNVFFFSVLSVVLAATDINRFTRFFLVSVFIILGSAITVNAFFLHKTRLCICMAKQTTAPTKSGQSSGNKGSIPSSTSDKPTVSLSSREASLL